MRFLVLTGRPLASLLVNSTVNRGSILSESGRSQSSKQRTVRVRAVVKFSVDKEGRSAVYSAFKAARYIFLYAFRECAGSQLGDKKGDIQMQYQRVSGQVLVFESVLIFEQNVVHLPKVPLCSSCFGSFGGAFSMRMYRGQRKISKCKTQ